MLNFIGVIVAVLAVIVAFYKWSFQYWKRKNVPCIEPSIPFGSMTPPYKRTMSLGDEFATFYKEFKAKGYKYGGIYSLATPTFVVTDLELLKSIMTKDFDYFVDRGLYINEKVEPISSNLFAIGGTKWRNLRVKFTPTFTSGKMKAMFQTLVDCGVILEKYLLDEVKGNEAMDIKDVLARFTTDIIGSCAFGLDCNSFKEPNAPFVTFGQKIFYFDRLRSLKSTFTFNCPNISQALGLRLFPKDVSNFYTEIVHDTVSYREKNNVSRKDFLQLLIEMKNNIKQQENTQTGDGKSLTMDELVAQCFIFFLAGFETSSSTMTFALFELAAHPDIQEKVRQEIQSVLKKYDNKITYDAMNELKYMRQVLDETLRKYPPLPFITRRCVRDYKLPGEDVIIEKGTAVVISVRGIHYGEEYYKDPEVFDPERFSEENKKDRHQYAYIPFGEGPRICIGMRFGIMESQVGLTCLLRNFKFTLNERTKVPLKMSTKSVLVSSTEGGIWLNVEKI